jgi:hypothetical protein
MNDKVWYDNYNSGNLSSLKSMVCDYSLCEVNDLRDDARTNRLATLTQGEPEDAKCYRGSDIMRPEVRSPSSYIRSHIVDEVAYKFDIISGHDHLLRGIGCALGEGKAHSHVGCPQEHLWPVVVHERSVPATFILGHDVNLRLKLLYSLHRAGLDDHHATGDLLALDTTQKSTHVVTSLSSVELLVEHLNARKGRFDLLAEPNDFHVRTLQGLAALDAAGGDRTTSSNREDILDTHKERLVEVA